MRVVVMRLPIIVTMRAAGVVRCFVRDFIVVVCLAFIVFVAIAFGVRGCIRVGIGSGGLAATE